MTTDPRSNTQESLSQLLAKILDQLSISAWLPAGALVSIVVFFGSFRIEGGDLGRIINAIGSINLITLALLIVAVVLVTMVTQAFEFEAIRLLEGYWGQGLLRSRLSDFCCERQIRWRNSLKQRKENLERSAFAFARQEMLQRGVDRLTVDILEAEIADEESAIGSEEDRRAAQEMGWYAYARPADVRRLNDFDSRLLEYPSDNHLVLPTRLGNRLRAYEERAHAPGTGSLEGMVIRVFHSLPVAIQSEHDQYRARLDLYCSMVVIFFLAALAAEPALFVGDLRPPLVALGVFLSLALLSYRAAIASARPYGIVLEEVGRLVGSRGGTAQALEPGSSGPASAS